RALGPAEVWGNCGRLGVPTSASISLARLRFAAMSPPRTTVSSPSRLLSAASSRVNSGPHESTSPDGPDAGSAAWTVGSGGFGGSGSVVIGGAPVAWCGPATPSQVYA